MQLFDALFAGVKDAAASWGHQICNAAQSRDIWSTLNVCHWHTAPLAAGLCFRFVRRLARAVGTQRPSRQVCVFALFGAWREPLAHSAPRGRSTLPFRSALNVCHWHTAPPNACKQSLGSLPAENKYCEIEIYVIEGKEELPCMRRKIS